MPLQGSSSLSAQQSIGQEGESTDAPASESGSVQRYGYDLFQPDGYNQEMMSGALPQDYRLGPGDQLGVYLGGKTQENFSLTFSVDGKLYIPTVGVLFVRGMTLEEFHGVLNKKLGAYYSDYSQDIMLTMPQLVGGIVIGCLMLFAALMADMLNRLRLTLEEILYLERRRGGGGGGAGGGGSGGGDGGPAGSR